MHCGGMYLNQNTEVKFLSMGIFLLLSWLTMINNSAQYGGEIFVADDIEGGSAYRSGKTVDSVTQSQCFIDFPNSNTVYWCIVN